MRTVCILLKMLAANQSIRMLLVSLFIHLEGRVLSGYCELPFSEKGKPINCEISCLLPGLCRGHQEPCIINRLNYGFLKKCQY